MKRAPLVALCGFVLASCSPEILAGESRGPISKANHPWGNYKVGTWIKHKSITKMVIPGTDLPPQTGSMKRTLKTTNPDHAVLEIEFEAAGRKSTVENKHPWAGQKGAKWEKIGTEKIHAAGKDFTCDVWKMTFKNEQVEMAMTTWFSKGVQGDGGVKSKTTHRTQIGGKEMVTNGEMLLTKQGEILKVDGKEVKCDVFSMVTATAPVPSKSTIWMSDSIPGRMVKTVTKGSMGSTKTETTVILEGFEVK